jgi:hypothetical protein
MRRRKLLVALAGLAVVVAAGVIALWPTRPNRVTRENYDRIQIGMTRAEVEAILGPPGDYTTRPQTLWWPPWSVGLSDRWRGDEFAIGLIFDHKRRVRVKYCADHIVLHLDQTAFDNLLWRAKRQWHRWFPE